MMSRWCLWMTTALLTLDLACSPRADTEQIHTTRRFVVLVVDLTTSMPEEDFNEGIGLLVTTAVPAFRDGDRAALIRLTGDSFQTRSDFWTFPVSDQYFDPQHEAVMDSLRQDVRAKLEGLARVDDRRTDVCGALKMAGNFFASVDSAMPKFLLIVSDFDDNIRGRQGCPAADLRSVKAYGLYASHKTKVERWQQWFHECGTVNTFIWDRNMVQLHRDRLADSLLVGGVE